MGWGGNVINGILEIFGRFLLMNYDAPVLKCDNKYCDSIDISSS